MKCSATTATALGYAAPSC